MILSPRISISILAHVSNSRNVKKLSWNVEFAVAFAFTPYDWVERYSTIALNEQGISGYFLYIFPKFAGTDF